MTDKSETSKQQLSPEAERALAEAKERRAAKEATQEVSNDEKERGGPSGVEPTRYGDWERKGIAYDF